MWFVAWGVVAVAGPERVERVHARKEAAEIELLQRSTCRAGVQQQAIARYLDRWSALDTRPVQRIEAWGEALRPPLPEEAALAAAQSGSSPSESTGTPR